MEFLRRSIIAKSSAVIGIAALVLGGITYASQYVAPEEFQPYTAPFFILIFGIMIFGILFLWVHRPLQTVFQEMKALLTGRPFKKVLTNRLDEIGILAHFFNDVTKKFHRLTLDVEEGRRMSKELSVGSDIQRKILPKEMPSVPGILLFGNTRPASEVGGDSYDVIRAGANTFMYVGDVTGHGLPAGLIMVMVNTLIHTYSEVYANSYDVIVNTNRVLKQRIEPRRFMTCVLLRWNSDEKKMYYTGAGHEHILIFHRKDGVCEVKQTGGIALGMVPDITRIVKEEQIPFEIGDYIVLYSDGVAEAKNMQDEMFGVECLKKAVEQYASTSTPPELFTNISKDFGNFVGEQTQADDITLITIQRLP